MEKACPNKKFHLLTNSLACYDMKLTKLEDIYYALRDNKHVIEVEESIRTKAFIALDKMMKLS